MDVDTDDMMMDMEMETENGYQNAMVQSNSRGFLYRSLQTCELLHFIEAEIANDQGLQRESLDMTKKRTNQLGVEVDHGKKWIICNFVDNLCNRRLKQAWFQVMRFEPCITPNMSIQSSMTMLHVENLLETLRVTFLHANHACYQDQVQELKRKLEEILDHVTHLSHLMKTL